MKSENKIIRHAFDTYRIAPLSSWILGLVTGLIITALVAVDLVLPFSSFITMPLIILPIIFSSTLQHLIFKTNGQLTFSTSFRGYALYYSRLYRSSFRYFFSLLKAIATFFIVETVVSFITSSIMQLTNPNFLSALNEVYEILYSEEATMDQLYAMLDSYNGILFTYLSIVLLPALFMGVIVFIYSVSRYSLMIYYQMEHPNINPRFTKIVYADLMRKYRFMIFKDYYLINWPLYVLLATGFGVGAYLGYLWEKDLLTMVATGLTSGALLSTFFLPFYFSNQEALYDKYAEKINASTKSVTSMMLMNIQRNIDLSNEEKERLEKSLGQSGLSIEDEEKDNKKGPDGP